MATWQASYVSGDWVLLTGPYAVVAVQPSAAGHWAALDRALDELRVIRDFPALTRALLGWDTALSVDLLLVVSETGEITVAVRGALKVSEANTGIMVVDGRGGVMWQCATGAINPPLRIDFEGTGAGAGWDELAPGMVQAATLVINATGQGITLPPVAAPAASPPPVALALGQPEVAAVIRPIPDDATQVIPVVTDVDTPEWVLPDSPTPTTPVTLPAPWPPPFAATAVPEVTPEPEVSDERTTITNISDVQAFVPIPKPPPTVTPAPVLSPAAPVSAVAPAAVVRTPAAPVAPAAPGAPASVATAQLAFSDGRVLPLSESVVVGRAPQVAPGDRAVPIKVYSPNRDVSRTHLRIDPQGAEWLVSDLNSTNGTLVRRPGEATIIATEEAPVPVGFGALVALGDNVVFRIDPVAPIV
ncbi:MAG: FHA domain-containing protein [Propionibacteriaceae bacterium]|jgi:hypothetical protein|nr:FHA domain-containing protein [Propionibacteriaceae bacterium]